MIAVTYQPGVDYRKQWGSYVVTYMVGVVFPQVDPSGTMPRLFNPPIYK
jgi:hypothetical protein